MKKSRSRNLSATPPLSAQELWLVTMVSLCLIWTTWALGGVRLWGQSGTAILALLALVAGMWPTRNLGWGNLRALYRFPVFWLGIFVCLYIVLQAVNASWAFELGPDGRQRIVKLSNIDWLPSSVRTSWRQMSPWRMLLIFLPCWFITCALWCGSYRPKTMRALMWVQSLNCSAFAIVGIIQAVTQADKVLWLFDRPVKNAIFWGTIANQNHSSAFMNLGLASALTLFLYYTGRHGKDITKGGAYLMLMPLSVIIIGGILQAMSRAAIVVTALIILSFVAVLLWRFVRMLREGGNQTLAVVFVAVMLLITSIVGVSIKSAVNVKMLKSEIRSMIAVAGDPENDTRYYINLASRDLFAKKPLYGWGAGCYRYFIGVTQKNYPLKMPNGRPFNIVFAHNDYLNCLCDIGIVGTVPLFAGIIGLPFFVLFFRREGIDGAFLMGLAGLFASMLHSTLEFFMQHPLVALQYSILFAVVTRMGCLRHHQRVRAYNDASTKELQTPS